MNQQSQVVRNQSLQILENWLKSCTRRGKLSRNTIAIGIVVLHHLHVSYPITKENVISEGGEIKGARSGLGVILETYGIPSGYLKEVTTRQGPQDGQRLLDKLDWGTHFTGISNSERTEILKEMLGILSSHAKMWLDRKNLELQLDRKHAPMTWVQKIVERSKGRSTGIVEQHLVGAKLERRFESLKIPNHPAHAADKQTAREGDFTISNLVYHVTANPSGNVIQKCADNIKSGRHPLLLVPSEQEYKAKVLAQEASIDNELTIISIEAFIAINIIELAMEDNKEFFDILREIIEIYNTRLTNVETDLSLRIDIS